LNFTAGGAKGLRFSDGKPVTAASFRLAFLRSLAVQPAARRIMADVSGVSANGNKLMTNFVPVVPFENLTQSDLVSARVKNFVFQPAYGGMNLGAVQIK
jgi:hypothetical protein